MALLIAASSPPGKTQITSTSDSEISLGSLVNGSEGGSCNSGICAITGGTAKNNKLFHRLTEFYAHSGIDKVTINNDQSTNNPYQSVIVANVDDNQLGTFIDTPIEFTTSKSDLIILAPFGIRLGTGAQFTNIGSIALSTSDQLRIGDETFHFLFSNVNEINNFSDSIELIQDNFINGYPDGAPINIVIDVSEQLAIEGDLLLHGIGGVYINSNTAGERAKLNVANGLDIHSSGDSMFGEVEQLPNQSTTLDDLDITAQSVNTNSVGTGVQTLAIKVNNTKIKSTEGNISLKGISGDEVDGGENNLQGIFIEANSTLVAEKGNIQLDGHAGNGNNQTVTETYNWEDGGSQTETFDVAVGRGIEINDSSIEAKEGTIDIDSVASHGSIVFYGNGAELRNSKLEANQIDIKGTSAKSTVDTKHSFGISLESTTLLGESGIDLIGQPGHQEANGPNGENVGGIRLYDSELTSSNGKLKLTGIGGSGTILDDSEGIYVGETTLRASAIDLNGTGGKAAKPNLSDKSTGIRIRQSTLDTGSPALTLTTEANGNIVLKGTGGSGKDDISGISIVDGSTIDSSGSIEITGQGGFGDTLKNVNGVLITGEYPHTTITEGDTTIKANKAISINGEGGLATKNNASVGVRIVHAEIESDQKVEIKGVGGTSTGTSIEEENHNGLMEGVTIWGSTITVNSSDTESSISNPYGATLIVDGSAGRSDGFVSSTSGVLLDNSTLKTDGVLHLKGSGGDSSSNVSLNSSGIWSMNGNLQGSSVQIEGQGGSSSNLDAINPVPWGQNDLGLMTNRYTQISRGVYLQGTNIAAATGSTNHNGAISINGVAKEGNANLNGIELYEATLDAETDLTLVGKGGTANTDVDIVFGIQLVRAELDAGNTINLTGEGGQGYGTSNYLRSTGGIDSFGSIISQTGEQGSVTIKGTGGSSEGELKDSYGVLIAATTVNSQGAVEIDGNGGQGLKVENVGGVALHLDTNILTTEELKIKGVGGESTTSALIATGVNVEKTDLTALSIEMDGTGGKAEKSNPNSEILVGIYLNQANISTSPESYNTGNIVLKGNGGVGYQNLAGVDIMSSSIKTDKDIVIEGTAGTGEKVEYANGVFLYPGEIWMGEYDNNGDPIFVDGPPTIFEANDLIITGNGGQAEISATQSMGIALMGTNLNLAGSIKLQGNGGTGSNIKSIGKPELNNGVSLAMNNIKTGGDFTIEGTAGTGGDFVIGYLGEMNTYDINGNVFVTGKGGQGPEVKDSYGVGFWGENWTVNGNFIIDGTGGSGTKTNSAYGTAMRFSKVIANTIDISGKGGNSTDTQDSRENYGSQILFSDLKSISGNISISGDGGTGGEDDTGIVLATVNLNSAQDIKLDGKGGAGDIVKFSRGIGIYSETYSYLNEELLYGNAEEILHMLPISLEEFQSQTYEYSGTTWYENSINANNVSIKGEGGLANNKNESGDNQGIYIKDSHFNLSGNLEIDGAGGDGGSLVTGVETINSDFDINGDMLVKGHGGKGDIIRFAEGILIKDSDFYVSGKQIQLEGRGGTGSKIRDGIGIDLDKTDLIALNKSSTIQLKGWGGEATNKIDSKDNTGIKIFNTNIVGGQHQNIIGVGGNGGKKNNGLLIRNTHLKSDNGDLTLSGTGGEGINIQKGSGIVIDADLSTENSSEQPDTNSQTTSAAINSTVLKADSIELKGSGGTSVITKNAINEKGEDTFNQTAENRGIRIQDATLTAQSGHVSLSGNGGTLLVNGIKNPDKDSEVTAISQASDLEGVSLKDVSSKSTQWTYIGGQAGQPIAGNKNSGTTIVSSTIRTATKIPTTSSSSTVAEKAKARSISPAQENRIEGNAFSGTNDNYGLTIDNTTIESKYDSLTLAGQGGLKATGEKNYGIYIRNGSSIEVGSEDSSHNLKIYGAGGDGTDITGGILTENTSYKGSGNIVMVGASQGTGDLSDAIEISKDVSIESGEDTDISSNNNVNISDSSVDTGNDLTLSAEEDLNVNESEISSNENVNAVATNDINVDSSNIVTEENINTTAGNDVNIDDTNIDSQGDINTTAGNDLNIDDTNIDSQGDINTTAGNDLNIDDTNIDSQGDINATADNNITISDSEMNSNNTTLNADKIELENTIVSADQNLDVIAISGLDITSSELDASDAIALNSYSTAIESSTVTTTDLSINSTELTQKESSFEANSFSVNNEQNSDDNRSSALKSLGLDVNTSLQTVGAQANDSPPTQSNSELTMSLVGGVNYILDDSAQESSSNDSQVTTTTSDSSTSTSSGSKESSSVDNKSVSSDASLDSQSDSEQAKSGDDDQDSKDNSESSKDQKTPEGSDYRLPTQELTIKQTQQIHQESEAQSSKFVANQLGLSERPAMTIQEIQKMLISGMALMNNSRQ